MEGQGSQLGLGHRGGLANAALDQFLPSPSLSSSERRLPLFVEGTLKGDVLLHSGIEQPWFLRSIGHGASLPGIQQVGVGEAFSGARSQDRKSVV